MKQVCVIITVIALSCFISSATAEEVTVQNDSLTGGNTGALQAGFASGESAAAWLTSPCDGNIVAVQIFWRSLFGGKPQSLEDSISIFAPNAFPTPGAALQTINNVPAVILGPVLTDGVINEFRFLDENQVMPLTTPISIGDQFVVSFKFFNAPSPIFGPSVVTDSDGCTSGGNAIFAIPGGWLNACTLGVTGDFVIRAVVDCNPSEACCFDPDGCVDLSFDDCMLASGTPQGFGTSCDSVVCFPSGACCTPDGACVADQSPEDCSMMGGVFQGDMTVCGPDTCPAPEGACCLSNGNCLELIEDDCTIIPGAFWAGGGTDCSDTDVNGTADACELTCDAADVVTAENKLGDTCVTAGDCSNNSPCIEGRCYVRKLKYISFAPGNGGTMTAIRVTLQDSVLFPGSVGQSWWVQPHDAGDPAGIYRLGCDPHYQNWNAAPAVIHVTGEEIASQASYDVQAIRLGCPEDQEPSYSAAVGLPTTQTWGDCCGAAQGGQYQPPDFNANLVDVQAAILKFQSAEVAPNLEWVDIDPASPNGIVNLADAFRFVQAFQGAGYPYNAPPACP